MADELVETPQAEEANEQAQEAVETIKEEVDKRDDAILDELKNIHQAIMAQTEHHIRHLEQHTLTSQAPVQQVAEEPLKEEESETEQEPVALQIDEPSDMVNKDEKKDEQAKKRRKAHGRKR